MEDGLPSCKYEDSPNACDMWAGRNDEELVAMQTCGVRVLM